MNKLRNKKVIIDGILFDSKAEAKYYCYLKREKEAGRVTWFERQPRRQLIPGFERNGRRYLPMTYTPDFLVQYADGSRKYIDVKGMETQEGVMRRKLFAYKYEEPLVWVSYSLKWGDESGFIDYDELKRIRTANKRQRIRQG